MKNLITKSIILTISFLFLSCLATNTTTESSISKNITKSLTTQQVDESSFLYPKGAYQEFNDFANRIPTKEISFKKSQLKHIFSSNYQLKYDNGKRVKEPFAVSNGTELFVRVYHMKKQIESKYKGKPSDANRDYLLAYYVNDNFLYFENEFISDYGLVAKFVRYGILYNSSTRDFTIFDENLKLSRFIDKNFPELKSEYTFVGKKPDLIKVRKLMDRVFEN